MSSSATGGALVFNSSSYLLRGANGLDIQNPSLFKSNLGINFSPLTFGSGLIAGTYNASVPITLNANVSQNGYTSSSSQNYITQYSTTGGLTCNNISVGTTALTATLNLGGNGVFTCNPNANGALSMSYNGSGSFGMLAQYGSLSLSAINCVELYATGYKQITSGTGTIIQTYTGSTSNSLNIVGNTWISQNLLLGGTLSLNGATPIFGLNATGGFGIDNIVCSSAISASTIAAVSSITAPNIILSGAGAFSGNVIGNVITSNILTSNTLNVSNLKSTFFTTTTTNGALINVISGSTSSNALVVSGGLYANVVSGFGSTSNALTVVGNASIDNMNVSSTSNLNNLTISGVFHLPVNPSFCYNITTTSTGFGTLTQISAPIGMNITNIATGLLGFNTTGRYSITWDLLGYTGSTGNTITGIFYRGGSFYSYLFGNLIQYGGSFNAILDFLVGDAIAFSIAGSISPQRCVIMGRMIG